jgi:tetratricopeptide (TPR) repeat protein
VLTVASVRRPGRNAWFFGGVAALIVVSALLFHPRDTDGSVPFVPTREDTVLAHVQAATTPRARLMNQLRAELVQKPGDLGSALRLAQMDIEESRKRADPRFLGYAQAALSPWWSLDAPPERVLLLRATIRQSVHDFDSAMTDLNTILDHDPSNAQALLTRAVVHSVRGEYPQALADCAPLPRLTEPPVAAVCLASVYAVNGKAEAAATMLEQALTLPQLNDDERAWVKSVLGETYVRLSRDADAVRMWTEDHAADPEDAYVTGALADLLLDLGRPADAAKLVIGKEENDALLLRLALAESQLHGDAAKDADRHAKMLHERFAASHLRGDVVHRREESREVLDLEHDPDRALTLAIANFGVQREPWDVRVLLEAAKAARKPAAAKAALDFLARGHLQDPRISALAHDLGAP